MKVKERFFVAAVVIIITVDLMLIENQVYLESLLHFISGWGNINVKRHGIINKVPYVFPLQIRTKNRLGKTEKIAQDSFTIKFYSRRKWLF